MNVLEANVLSVNSIKQSSNRQYWMVFVTVISHGAKSNTILIKHSKTEAHAVKVGDVVTL